MKATDGGDSPRLEAAAALSMTKEERDAAMVEAYKDGATLQEIGDRFGITRERVRQIIKKRGGASAEIAREKRREQRQALLREREEARKAELDALLSRISPYVAPLVASKILGDQVVARVRVFFPDISVTDIEEACAHGGYSLLSPDQQLFSDEALAGALLYLAGAELSLEPDPLYAAEHAPLAMLQEVRNILLDGATTQNDVVTVLGVIGAMLKHLEENPSASITGARYETLRTELVEALGWVSAKGQSPWPPTRQTFILRYGSWNTALAKLGLGTSNKGRSPGLLKFSEADYKNAIVDFLEYCDAIGEQPTHRRYEVFDKQSSWDVPSPAGIRNYFGGWTATVRVGRELAEERRRTGVRFVSEEPVKSALPDFVSPEVRGIEPEVVERVRQVDRSGAHEYVVASSDASFPAEVLDHLDEAQPAALVLEQFGEIANVEGPVSLERAAKIVTGRFGLKRLMAARKQSLVDLARPMAQEVPGFGAFLWPDWLDAADYTGFRPIAYASTYVIDFADVHPIEVRNALIDVLQPTWPIGLRRDEAAAEVLRSFGFTSPRAELYRTMEKFIEWCAESGFVLAQGAQIGLPGEYGRR